MTENHHAHVGNSCNIDLSIVFVSFNRSDLLERAFYSIRDRLSLDGIRVEYIVTDDASSKKHLVKIKSIPFDRFVLSKKNRGLGENTNRGLAVARGRYILQVQDDFEFHGPSDLLVNALEVFEHDKSVGMIQLTNPTPNVPSEVRYLADGRPYYVFINDNLPFKRPCGERPYSDQPHLKRDNFIRSIGPYKESVPMTTMELDYQMRVANQSRWGIANFSHEDHFEHLGVERSFNPGNILAKRVEKLEAIPGVKSIISLIKYLRRSVKSF